MILTIAGTPLILSPCEPSIRDKDQSITNGIKLMPGDIIEWDEVSSSLTIYYRDGTIRPDVTYSYIQGLVKAPFFLEIIK